ncbi:MAG: hypothetical protein PsegKO_04860 [Pseudohongiellaceae bacterium]
MKIRRNRLRPEHPDRTGHLAVHTLGPGLGATVYRTVKMNYLARGMNASISSTGAGRGDRLIGNAAKGSLEGRLHGRQVR